MARKRKTRKQKLLSDLRHQSIQSPAILSSDKTPSSPLQTAPSYTFTPKSTTPAVTSVSAITPATTYAYVTHDLRKTALLTSAIVLAELILHFGIKAF